MCIVIVVLEVINNFNAIRSKRLATTKSSTGWKDTQNNMVHLLPDWVLSPIRINGLYHPQ